MNVHSHGTGPSDKPADKRAAILDAALVLFCERGFHGTSVPAVAAAARVATGTIYRHFASKEELVNSLYQFWKTRLMLALLEDFPFDAPLREQFHRFWFRMAEFIHARPLAFSFLELHHHSPYLDPTSLAMENNAMATAFDFLHRARLKGQVKDVPEGALIALVWGVLVGMVKAKQLGHLELDEPLLTAMETCCWDAIRARE